MGGHIEDKRLKDISLQLIRVIHIVCNSKGEDMQQLLSTYTNISEEEMHSIQCIRKK